MRKLRVFIAMILITIGIIGFILPGSMFILLGGLMLMSIDYPPARHWLRKVQRASGRGARKLDQALLNRKMRN